MNLESIAEAAIVRPGAKLLIRVDTKALPSVEQMSEMKRRLEEELPGVEVLIIGCDQLAVYEREEES